MINGRNPVLKTHFLLLMYRQLVFMHLLQYFKPRWPGFNDCQSNSDYHQPDFKYLSLGLNTVHLAFKTRLIVFITRFPLFKYLIIVLMIIFRRENGGQCTESSDFQW